MRRKYRCFLGWLILILAMAGFFYFQNNGLVTTELRYQNAGIPAGFDGFVILQVSDLHNKSFGEDQTHIISAVAKAEPDIIVITGDLIDARRRGMEAALCFTRAAANIAPIYYISGNHEPDTDLYEELLTGLERAGATLLLDRAVTLERNGDHILLAGVTDETARQGTGLFALGTECAEDFSILLSHRPELVDAYHEAGFDLVFSGHAHGGQIRLPGLGGLFAPGQGVLPRYTAGLYERNGTSLIVSRGLGNSAFPLRVFNRPELVRVILKNS